MKQLNEIRFNPELMDKIEACHSAEELVKLAADNGIEVSLADAEKYFEKGIVKLGDDEVDRVAGGCEPDGDSFVNDSQTKHRRK